MHVVQNITEVIVWVVPGITETQLIHIIKLNMVFRYLWIILDNAIRIFNGNVIAQIRNRLCTLSPDLNETP